MVVRGQIGVARWVDVWTGGPGAWLAIEYFDHATIQSIDGEEEEEEEEEEKEAKFRPATANKWPRGRASALSSSLLCVTVSSSFLSCSHAIFPHIVRR